MENTVFFSGRLTISAGSAETIVQELELAYSENRTPMLAYVCIEPDAANVTSVEVGFVESTTGAFLPRCETTSTLARREYSGILQQGPRGGRVAVRMVAGAATACRVLYDGMMVDG